ncbi:hypothetical protein WL99_01775 [Burkholderia cepacia]|nr:hypothetical protein WL99_01775 [Burkholderia cepacia]
MCYRIDLSKKNISIKQHIGKRIKISWQLLLIFRNRMTILATRDIIDTIQLIFKKSRKFLNEPMQHFARYCSTLVIVTSDGI